MQTLISKANQEVYKVVIQSEHPLKDKIELAYIYEDNDRINRLLLSIGVDSNNKRDFIKNVDNYLPKFKN